MITGAGGLITGTGELILLRSVILFSFQKSMNKRISAAAI